MDSLPAEGGYIHLSSSRVSDERTEKLNIYVSLLVILPISSVSKAAYLHV